MTLVMENVSKVYKDGPKEFKAVDQASLEVKPGEFIAIIGPSGSGKSTMLSIAGALLAPTSGKVLLDGENVAELSAKKITRQRLEKIGFVFQAANLIPYLKVKDQLQVINVIAKNKGQSRSSELLKHFGLDHRTTNYPSELSGGERQRVAIARALINIRNLYLQMNQPRAWTPNEGGRLSKCLLMKSKTAKRRVSWSLMMNVFWMYVTGSLKFVMANWKIMMNLVMTLPTSHINQARKLIK